MRVVIKCYGYRGRHRRCCSCRSTQQGIRFTKTRHRALRQRRAFAVPVWKCRRYLGLPCQGWTKTERKTSPQAHAFRRRMEFNLISRKKLVLFHSGSGPREMGLCLPSTTTVCANLHTIKTNMSLFWKIRRPFCWVRQPGEQRLRLSDIPLWQNIPGFLFSILVNFGSNMFRHASHWDFTCSHDKTLYHSECSILDCLVKGLTTDKKRGLEIGVTCSRGGGERTPTNWPVNVALTGTASLSSGFVQLPVC